LDDLVGAEQHRLGGVRQLQELQALAVEPRTKQSKGESNCAGSALEHQAANTYWLDTAGILRQASGLRNSGVVMES
jgi:hypothetical protein